MNADQALRLANLHALQVVVSPFGTPLWRLDNHLWVTAHGWIPARNTFGDGLTVVEGGIDTLAATVPAAAHTLSVAAIEWADKGCPTP